MSIRWQIENSPTTRQNLTTEEVREGIMAGDFQGDDRIRQAGQTSWVSLEDAPAFRELVAAFSEPEPTAEEETRLDMNPMIDVALVLLIFFILTTSYAELRKEIAPPLPAQEDTGKQTKTMKEVAELTIRVQLKQDGKTTRIRIEESLIDADKVEETLKDWIRKTGKAQVFLEVGPGVPLGAVTDIQDAALAANVKGIVRAIPKKKSE